MHTPSARQKLGAEECRARGMSSLSKVGILADTHGLLDARVCPSLSTSHVDYILHAGDVADASLRPPSRLGAPDLLAALAGVAPVIAVRGNADDSALRGSIFPETSTLTVGGLRFFLHHGDLICWKDDDAVLDVLRPAGGWRTGDVVVGGHSHAPRFVLHVASGVYFLNPG